MKIVFYCQYVWGLGHLFRSLEICRALSGHEVTLVSGGLPVKAHLPEHVREIRLPGLLMGDDYKTLISAVDGRTVDRVKKERRDRLTELFQETAPDIFLIELYPFGRRAFRYELDPIFKGIRIGNLPPSRVICSLRDILVEKKDAVAYEKRVVDALNRHFDALLIHSDPELLKLDETFARTVDIAIPMVYTGFVTPKPEPIIRKKFRQTLGIDDNEVLIVASAGGGRSGAPLLESLMNALPRINTGNMVHLHLFTGPFVSENVFDRLQRHSCRTVRVSKFTHHFLSYLVAADLSVSMSGYNTAMNIMAAGAPSLVWPFPEDREQGIRAQMLARIGAVTVLQTNDLHPSRLASMVEDALNRHTRFNFRVDLNGAKNTANWLTGFTGG